MFDPVYSPGDNYENASALVVTFTVNNFKEAEFQRRAKIWESGFLKHIESYRKRNDSNISISYSTEVCENY